MIVPDDPGAPHPADRLYLVAGMGTRAGNLRYSLALFAVVLIAACGTAAGAEGGRVLRAVASQPSPSPLLTPAPATPSPTPPPPTPAPREEVTATSASRAVHASSFVFAQVGGVQMVHPADRVARVGFHQASDVASLDLEPVASAVRPVVLPTRHRPTPGRSAVDIVVHPQSEIVSPVSGIVKRAGNYVLYCKTDDSFVVISPDGHPSLEVKMLHVSGLRVRPGDRVEAGRTLVAKRPTKLPFSSQVDTFTPDRVWPHVHMEVTKLAVPSAVPVTGPSTLAMGNCG